MKRVFVLAVLTAVLIISGCGGGGGNGSLTATPNSGNTTINFGDATNDQIIVFELLINSITLNGGSNPSVLPKPTEFEFTHAAGSVEPLSVLNVPPGTYTGATISVANPEVVIVNAGAPQQVPATLSSSTINVTFSAPITIGTGAAVLNFDLNLATSVTLNGNPVTSATVTPQFTVTTSTVPAAGAENENEDNGEVDDLRGVVTSVASPKFTIQPSQTAQPVTISTDSNTQFSDGITSFSQITNGMLVSVDAVTQSDGTILAKKVEAETETQNGEEVEGIITAVTGAPATQITVTTQKTAATGTAPNTPATGTSVTVSIGNGTKFMVDPHKLNGPFPAFDASHIGKAQRVEVDSESQTGNTSTSVTGDKIKLSEQALTGTVSALSGNTFTLTVDSTSAFASLSGATTVTVQTQSATELKNVTLSNTATVRVRGLLFVNGTAYTMVAARITQP
jgi:uncharacterized protein DUF5666